MPMITRMQWFEHLKIPEAIFKLTLNNSDVIIGLQSDHFVNAGDDLPDHLAMLLTGCLMQGYVPDELCVSSVILILKGNNCDSHITIEVILLRGILFEFNRL